MKRIFTLLVALIMSITVKAQCPITEAIDFTATDCHGQEIHLFDTNGKLVKSSREAELDMNDLSNGIYLLQVRTQIVKVIKASSDL